MSFRLTKCYQGLCPTPDGGTSGVEGFVLITLRSCVDVTSAFDNTTGVSYPVSAGAETVVRADIDPVTGCWVSCELPCNSDLSPAGTYYEIVEYLNGQGCTTPIVAQVCCDQFDTSEPIDLSEVASMSPPKNGCNGCGSGCAPSGPDCLCITQVQGTGEGCLSIAAQMLGSTLQIAGSLAVDPSADNQLVCGVAGLFVEPQDIEISDDPCNALSLQAGGLFVPEVHVNVEDTSTIVMAIDGEGTCDSAWSIYGEVQISGDDDNAISVNGDGLYVPGVNLIGDAGACGIEIDVTGAGTPTSPWVVTPTLLIDASTTDNLLLCGPNGLRVPGYALEGSDNGCIDIDVTGAGTEASPWVATGQLNIDPASNIGVSCGPNGLLLDVDFPEALELPKFIGECGIDLVYDADENCVTVGVLVSDAPGNALECTTDGLFVHSTVVDGTDGDGTVVTVTPGPDGSYDVTVDVVIDPDSTAPITVGPNGILVDCCAPEIVVSGNGCVEVADNGGSGLSGDPLEFVVSVDLDVQGGIACGPDGLGILLDPASPVDISLSEDGLYVGCCALQILTNGSPLGVEQVDAVTWDITLLSEDPDNILVEGSDGGLYVDCVGVLECFDGITTDGTPLGVSGDYAAGWDITLLSGDAGNVLVTGADGGLFVDCPAVIGCLADITVNGDTVSITGDYATGWDITTLSGDAGNVITLGSDGGLFVDCVAIGECFVIVSGDDDNLITVGTDGGAHLECADVLGCFGDITTDGTPAGVTGDNAAGWDITLLSTDADNLLSTGADGGLFVSCEDTIGCLAGITVNGATTAISGDYADGWDITTISADTDNILVLGSDGGLFFDCAAVVDCLFIEGNEGECITTTITGAGTEANPFVFAAEPVIDPAVDNALSCGPDGLVACNTTRLSFSAETFCTTITCGPTAPVFADGFIIDGAITTPSPGGSTEAWDVLVNGAVVASVAASGVFTAIPGLPVAIFAGDIVSVAMVGAEPDTPSECVTATLRITEGC